MSPNQDLSPTQNPQPSTSPNTQYKNINLSKKRPLLLSPSQNNKRRSISPSHSPHPNALNRDKRLHGVASMPAALWARASPRSPPVADEQTTHHSAASVASRNGVTTPSKKYLPAINTPPQEGHLGVESHAMRRHSQHRAHVPLSPHISLTHPHQKYENSPILSYSNLSATSDISSRLASIEKGLARQLEAYVERERDLEHRLKVTTDEQKKARRESERLRERNQKLLDELKETKARAIDMVRSVEEKFMSASHHRREQEALENLTQLQAKREHTEEQIRALTQEVVVKQQQVEAKEQEMKRMREERMADLERQQLALDDRETEIAQLRAKLENERLVLQKKEQLIIEQDEHYHHMLTEVEQRERDADQRIKDEIKTRTKQIKEQLQKEFDAKLQAIQEHMGGGGLAPGSATPNALTPLRSNPTASPGGALKKSNSSIKPNTSELVRLTYISKGIMLEESDLKSMEEHCTEMNRKHRITSILFFHDNDPTLIQVIEGPENEVNALYRNILNDSRHFDVVCVRVETFVPERLLDDHPFRLTRVGTSMSFETRDILNRFYSSVLQQYAVIHRYAPPLILEPVCSGQGGVLARVTSAEKVVLYVEIMVMAPGGGAGPKLYDLEQERSLRVINRVLRICQDVVAQNGGLFVNFTPNLGMVSLFDEKDAERAADAALALVEKLRNEFDNAEINNAADEDLAQALADDTLRPFTSRNIAIAITKGTTYIGNVGGNDSMMFAAVGQALSLAQHAVHAMPEEYCIVFDSVVTKQLANPFFPKYAKLVTSTPVHSIDIVQKRGRVGKVSLHSLRDHRAERFAPQSGNVDDMFSKRHKNSKSPMLSARSMSSGGASSSRIPTLTVDTTRNDEDSMWSLSTP